MVTKIRILLTVWLATAFLPSVGSAATAVPDYSERSTCVIVHLKRDPTPYHLTVACDGERVNNQVLHIDDELAGSEKFHRSLFSQFVALVDKSGNKRCRQYEVDYVWWASCSR